MGLLQSVVMSYVNCGDDWVGGQMILVLVIGLYTKAANDVTSV